VKRWPVLKPDRSPASMEAMSRNLEEIRNRLTELERGSLPTSEERTRAIIARDGFVKYGGC